MVNACINLNKELCISEAASSVRSRTNAEDKKYEAAPKQKRVCTVLTQNDLKCDASVKIDMLRLSVTNCDEQGPSAVGGEADIDSDDQIQIVELNEEGELGS